MRTYNATTAQTLVNNLNGLVADLYYRWLDEYRYEDINDYATPIERVVGDKVKMTKRPFGFVLTCEYTYKDGTTLVSELKVERKARTYGWTVKPVKGAKPVLPANRLYGEYDECDEYGCPQHDGKRVAWVYAHGNLEDDMCHDCFYADNADVKNGDKAVYKGKEVVFHLYPLRGRLTGIACYTDDQEAMAYGQNLVKEQPQLF